MSLRIGDHEQNQFELCPIGAHPAQCVEVESLGIVETEYQGQKRKRPMVKLHFEIDKVSPTTGKPYRPSKRYTITIWPDAPLRGHVSGMLGRTFTDAEFQDFDLETLKGKMCLVVVAHESRNGKTYDDITAITQLPTAAPAPAVPTYQGLLSQIQACWTEPGLDGLKTRAVEAKRAGHITAEELQRLGEASVTQRQRIAEAKAKSAAAGGSSVVPPEEDEIPF